MRSLRADIHFDRGRERDGEAMKFIEIQEGNG